MPRKPPKKDEKPGNDVLLVIAFALSAENASEHMKSVLEHAQDLPRAEGSGAGVGIKEITALTSADYDALVRFIGPQGWSGLNVGDVVAEAES